MTLNEVTIVEVGPRDGFQAVKPLIPTAAKIDILEQLYLAGLRRVEATSFVSSTAVPQLADAAEIITAVADLPGLDAQVLAPTPRHADRAIAAGARHLVFVLSVSERHNLSNVHRRPGESVEEYRRIAAALPDGVKMRLNVATAFDCPFDGKVSESATFNLLEMLSDILPAAEIGLCDTTGRADPLQVGQLFQRTLADFSQVHGWAFHGHDTYELGAANCLAAWRARGRVLDAAIAGLGGDAPSLQERLAMSRLKTCIGCLNAWG